MIIDGYEITFGDQKAQEEFAKAYSSFFKVLNNLKAACQVAMDRQPQATFPMRLMFVFQQIICEEHFEAVINLCADGLSMCAMLVLRSMFEYTIIQAYIGQDPKRAMLYWDYYWLDLYKREKDNLAKMPEKRKQLIESNYKRVSEERIAEGLKDGRFWSAKDMRKMTKDLDFPDYFLLYAYDRPLEETHGTAGAVFRRLENREDGQLLFNAARKPAEDNITLMLAHWFVIKSLSVLKEHGGIEQLNDPLVQCDSDFQQVWGEKSREVESKARLETKEGPVVGGAASK